jgi:hypothetical protein
MAEWPHPSDAAILVCARRFAGKTAAANPLATAERQWEHARKGV